MTRILDRPSFKATAVIILVAGVSYWEFVCLIDGVDEAWDSNAYWWLWYPISIGLAAVAGSILWRRGWLAGLIITYAQLPVMWVNSGTASSWVLGVILSSVLAIPLVATSALASSISASMRRS